MRYNGFMIPALIVRASSISIMFILSFKLSFNPVAKKMF